MAKAKNEPREPEGVIIGALPVEIAMQIGKMPTDFVLNRRGREHIEDDHKKELEQLGLTAEDFCRYIVNNFNEIYTDDSNALFLVIQNGRTKMACTRLNYMEEGVRRVYCIETATPARKSYLKRKKNCCGKACTRNT